MHHADDLERLRSLLPAPLIELIVNRPITTGPIQHAPRRHLTVRVGDRVRLVHTTAHATYSREGTVTRWFVNGSVRVRYDTPTTRTPAP